MPFDLMLSENGDLVFSAIRDLQGIGGIPQVSQSIRTRLKIVRGSWDYDPDGILGSQLSTLTNVHPDQLQEKASMMVNEALRDMDDVMVDQVNAVIVDNDLQIEVLYHTTGESEIIDATTNDQIIVSIPLGG